MKLRLLRSRKGISPILATLLLIVIAVAAISVSYAWIMTYMDNTTGKAGIMLYEANVNFVSTPSKAIVIDVGNSGTSDATVKAIYYGTSESTMTNATGIASTTVTAGGTPASFTITFNWAASTTYYFKVVPSSGTPLTFNIRSP